MANVFSCIAVVCTVKDSENCSGLDISVASYSGPIEMVTKEWLLIKLRGELVEQGLYENLQRGHNVFVSGEIALGTYTDGGGKVSTRLELLANVFELINSKDSTALTMSKSNEGIEETENDDDDDEKYQYIEDLSGNYDSLLSFKFPF